VRSSTATSPSSGQESIDAAVGARCAARQNRYWQFHDYLFANQAGENQGAYSPRGSRSSPAVRPRPRSATERLRADPGRAQGSHRRARGGGGLGINSTPTLVIGDQLLVGVPRLRRAAPG
jgi:hypothetical protein